MRPIIHSNKHTIQRSIETVTAGTVKDFDIIHAVHVVNKNLAIEVEEGATVKAVYIEMWVRSGEITAGSGQAILYKSSGETGTPSLAEMADLNSWPNKKNILYTTQGLFNDQDTVAIPILKGWIKIPRGKQRFGLGDKLRLSISAAGAIDLHWCGFALYKEYT